MIPYVRTVNYLSPSALRRLEENPVEFYFSRLGPADMAPPRTPQGFPAAVGIAFDAMVKAHLSKLLRLPCPSFDYMLAEVTCERGRALEMAQGCMAGYSTSGALEQLLREGPTALAQVNEDFAPGTDVPLQSKLDAVTGVGVHDWKVLGAGRPGERSPTAGYLRLWDTDRPGEPSAPHKRSAEPLEDLDRDWATQLSIYGWALGRPVGEAMASVDEVVVGAGGRIRVAQFRSTISAKFQHALLDRLRDAWRRIKEERVVPDEIANAGVEFARAML